MTFTRKLGRSGIEVSALGMGCWAIGGPIWEKGTRAGNDCHGSTSSPVVFRDSAGQS